jgi:predicted regulator of Ras-like GTPase activity (Roadblock/LC7/MglB family)
MTEMPVAKRKTVQISDDEEEQVDWAPKIEEHTSIANLRAAVERIKSREGIIGYIIRGPTSASVDIKDPRKIIDYAALSTEAVESAEALSEAFDLGNVINIVVEGKNAKMLLLKKGEQELTVFIEKNVDHSAVLRELS